MMPVCATVDCRLVRDRVADIEVPLNIRLNLGCCSLALSGLARLIGFVNSRISIHRLNPDGDTETHSLVVRCNVRVADAGVPLMINRVHVVGICSVLVRLAVKGINVDAVPAN